MTMRRRAMTPQQKRDIIERLLSLWEDNPDLRLGQLISNTEGQANQFYLEDYQFMDMLEKYYEME